MTKARTQTLLGWGLVNLSLVIGILIYASTRHTLAFSVLDRLEIGFLHRMPRNLFGGAMQSTPEWVRFNLPDALWLFSLTLALRMIWSKAADKHHRTAWISLVLFLSIGSELLQALGWIGGTGDPLDAVAYSIGAAVAHLPFKNGFETLETLDKVRGENQKNSDNMRAKD